MPVVIEAQAVPTEAAAAARRPAAASALRAWLRAAIRRHEVPGVAVGVIAGDQEHIACAGVTSVDNPLPVDADTLFQIGSTTKTVTATALMILSERGQVDLDAPVRTHLPELRLRDEEVVARVTLRHLLTHTGGWEGDFFEDTGRGDDALARMVERMAELPQLTPLGRVWSYNNSGFYLAGRVIEAVTGMPYPAAIGELVLEPLGMSRSLFFAEDVIVHRFSVGHLHTADGRLRVARPWHLARSCAPAGGLVSSIRDQLTYARLHLAGGRLPDGTQLLRPQTVELMRSEQAEAGTLADHVGLSWLLQDVGGVRVVKHGGTTPGQTSAFLLVPERGFAIAVCTNSDRGAALHSELTDWALDRYLGVVAKAPETALTDAAAAAEYTGVYEAELAVSEVRHVEGELEVRTAPRNLPLAADIELAAPPPVRIRMVRRDRFLVVDGRARGTSVEFLRGEGGGVEWCRLGGRLARRAGTADA